MEPREPDATDTERVRELAESTMTASYSLSPQQIEALLEEGFDEDRLTQASDESVTLLAENTIHGEETTIAGVVEAEHTDEGGEVRWLFVDPEHRGQGIGTELFETAVEKLREQGAEPVRASTLEVNREGNQFPEQFGFERADDRTVEVAGESLVEYRYTASSTEAESATEQVEAFDGDLPNTETENGVPTATTDDRQVYINREEGKLCYSVVYSELLQSVGKIYSPDSS